jgi:chromosome segregation ATPase
MKELTEFFNKEDNNNANLTFSDIQAYIKKLKSEERKLQDEIQELKELKQDLEIETAALERLRDQTSKSKNITDAQIMWYSKLEGLSISDVNNCDTVNYNVKMFVGLLKK